MRQTIFPRREIFEQNHIAVPSGKIPDLCRIGRNIRYEKSVGWFLYPFSLWWLLLSYRARLADPAAHLSPQRKENPPPRSTTPFPPPATLHRPANPNLAHRHGYRKRDRQVSSRIHPTPKQATESGETEKRERAPTCPSLYLEELFPCFLFFTSAIQMRLQK